MVGKVLLSLVLLTPGMLPADLPSHSYRKRRPFEAGCSITFTWACFFDRTDSDLGGGQGWATATPGEVVEAMLEAEAEAAAAAAAAASCPEFVKRSCGAKNS